MKRQTSRREFIQQVSLAAGLSAIPTVWSDASPRAPRMKVEKLRLAHIGAGGQGRGDISNTSQHTGVEIAALCDVDSVRAAEMFKKYDSAKQYTDYREMIAKEKGNIDAVFVSIPDHNHAAASMAAMKAGMHLYCQKPLAHCVEEVRAMQKFASKSKLVTQMGTQAHRTYYPTVDVIKSGVLGQITEVHVVTDRSKGWWPQGMQLQPAAEQAPATLQWQQWLGPAADRTYSKDYLPFVWRGWWDFGTGALGDMACHLMDGPFQALNLKYPETVEAVSDVFSQFSPPVSAMITYQFGRRGDLGPVKLIWYDGGRRPPESVIEGRKLENGSIFVGEKGKLIVEHASSKPILFPEEKFATVTMKTYLAFDNKNHYFQFIDACIHGGPTDTTFNYACPLSETVLLGNVALRTGGKIEWDAARMRVKGRPDADVYIRKQYRPGYSL